MMAALIVQSQQGDSDASLELIKKFNFSLKKYAFKLRYEDAYNDLLADFIELIKNIQITRISDRGEEAIIAYIYAAIYNNYIKQLTNLKKRQLYEFLSYEALSESEKAYVEIASATYDSHALLELTGMVSLLTKRELLAFRMFFQFQYSIPEIASVWGVSEQAVRCTRDRALKKLRKWFAIEEAV